MQFVFGAARSKHHLDELLPRRFGPHDLLSASAFPLLMEVQHNDVALTASAQQAVMAREGDDLFQLAVQLAVQNAQQVGPYTVLESAGVSSCGACSKAGSVRRCDMQCRLRLWCRQPLTRAMHGCHDHSAARYTAGRLLCQHPALLGGARPCWCALSF